MTKTMPAIFFGHGNPMNAIQGNAYSKGWAALHAYAWGQRRVEPFDWAVRFEKKVRQLLLAGEDGPLVEYAKLGDDAILSAPTPDHYLPLLYIVALRRKGDSTGFPVEGVDGGSVSMLAVQIG